MFGGRVGASKYVGRVGGLAVALGVGVAVFTGAGAASADSDAGSSQSESNSAAGGGSPSGGAQAYSEGAATSDRPSRPRLNGPRSVEAIETDVRTAQKRVRKATVAEQGTSSTLKLRAEDAAASELSPPSSGAESGDAPGAASVTDEALQGSGVQPEPAVVEQRDSMDVPIVPITVPSAATVRFGTGHHEGSSPRGGSSPTTPAAALAPFAVAAATRRDLSGNGDTDDLAPQTAADATMSTSLARASAAMSPAMATAPRPNLTQLINTYIYAPIHAGLQSFLATPAGQQFAKFMNTVLASYAIGNGRDGTSDNPDGTRAGWLFGDGGAGWNSDQAGVSGGDGGAAGIFGSGGQGGAGGAGAAGGTGGSGGTFMGVGGDGGDGGDSTDGSAPGGAGGDGGAAPSRLFGIGGAGGHGGEGAVGGVGGDGGEAVGLLGNGGRGGDGGHGTAVGPLPALGGAGGGTRDGLGKHGKVGEAGTQAGIDATPPANSPLPGGMIPTITRTGAWLTDSEGRVVILRGFNVVDITDPRTTPDVIGFGEDDAAFLAANGFNVVRLGVEWSQLQPSAGVFDETYLNRLEQTVALLADHGIVTLLDMHENVPPDWVTGGLPPSSLPFPVSVFFDPAKNAALDRFWRNDELATGERVLNNYARMMQYLAHHFRGNSAVLGIEILNEPIPGNQFWPSVFGSSYFEAEQLTPFYNQVASAIRSVNGSVPMFFEPSVLATAMVPIRLGKVEDSNAVLSFHNYAFINMNGLVLPFVSTIASNALKYAEKHNIPAFLSEFGSSNNASSIRQSVGQSDANFVGWTEWMYSDTTFGGVDGTPEWLVKDPSLPPEGANVDFEKLKLLARPFAQSVAGTPISISFDDGEFRFGYSTLRADGQGRFGAGSESTFAIPGLHFPNGYEVTVTGGQVVSAPNATQLVIASDGSLNNISVTVRAVPVP